jgi:hypothetical protein
MEHTALASIAGELALITEGFWSGFNSNRRSYILSRMTLTDLVSSIDAEIARLQQARALLTGSGSYAPKAGRRAERKYALSAEARKRIGDAQRKRWAAQKKAAKKAV